MWVKRTGTSRQSDNELLSGYRRGKDIKLLGILYERYLTYTYGVCLKYFGEPQASQDAVMEIFEVLVDKVSDHDIKNFKSWLYVVAKNYCLGQIRKQKKARIVSLNGDVMHLAEVSHQEDEFDIEGKYEDLAACLQALPSPQQVTVQKFYLEGKSYSEIADDLVVSKERVRSYIQNGRRNLRICMEKKRGKET